MNPYLEIIRPANAVMAIIAVVLMGFVGHDFGIPLILGMIATFLALGGGNAINDVFDVNIDLINKPTRPIPSGRIKLKSAKIYSLGLLALAVIVGGIISFMVNNIGPVIIVFGACILEYFYARNLKSTVLIGNISVGILTGLCFLFGGVIIGSKNGDINLIITSLILAFFALLMTTAREIVKDTEDIEGDKKEGAKTFPIVYGEKASSYLAASLIIIDTILCPLLYVYHIFTVTYLVIVIVAMVLFFYSAYGILKDQSRENCARISKLLKIGMIIAFIAFALGSLI